MSRKTIYLSIGILLAIILAIYFVFFTCSDHYMVTCYHPDNENKTIKNISCISNDDCSVRSMVSYCSPDCPDLFYRTYGRYRCDDGYCKGCNAYVTWGGNDYVIFLPKTCTQ